MIEDACHAIGTRYALGGTVEGAVGDGRWADATAFSFHPVKAVAMGAGGAVTTNDPNLDEKLRRLRSHGMVRDAGGFQHPDLAFAGDGQVNPWYYEMPEPGFNYRASDIACALGRSQLAKLDRFVAARVRLVEEYRQALAPLAPVVRPLGVTAGGAPAWHLMVALIDFDQAGLGRGEVMRRLRQAGIGSQVHYLPVHLQPYYRRRGELTLPGAADYYRRCLSLPLFPTMAPGDVSRVVAALGQALGLAP